MLRRHQLTHLLMAGFYVFSFFSKCLLHYFNDFTKVEFIMEHIVTTIYNMFMYYLLYLVYQKSTGFRESTGDFSRCCLDQKKKCCFSIFGGRQQNNGMFKVIVGQDDVCVRRRGKTLVWGPI